MGKVIDVRLIADNKYGIEIKTYIDDEFKNFKGYTYCMPVELAGSEPKEFSVKMYFNTDDDNLDAVIKKFSEINKGKYKSVQINNID